jgi:hypothetical protein
MSRSKLLTSINIRRLLSRHCQVLSWVVDLCVVSASPASLPSGATPAASARYRWLTSALAALVLVASAVGAAVLGAFVVDRALYDPLRIGQAGWRLNLAIGASAVVIGAVLVVSGWLLLRAQRRASRRSRYAGAVIAVVLTLVPGVWLGEQTSAPVHAVLAAASGSASRPLSESEASSAVSPLADRLRVPAGWTRKTQFCPEFNACWTSQQTAFFTKTSFTALAKQFWIRLQSAQCDEPLRFPKGRDVQDCYSYGLTSQFQVDVVLQVRRGMTSDSDTELDVAPVRRLT